MSRFSLAPIEQPSGCLQIAGAFGDAAAFHRSVGSDCDLRDADARVAVENAELALVLEFSLHRRRKSAGVNGHGVRISFHHRGARRNNSPLRYRRVKSIVIGVRDLAVEFVAALVGAAIARKSAKVPSGRAELCTSAAIMIGRPDPTARDSRKSIERVASPLVSMKMPRPAVAHRLREVEAISDSAALNDGIGTPPSPLWPSKVEVETDRAGGHSRTRLAI